jgi:hypothetical protein
MSDPRLLGFLNVEPRLTDAAPRREWGRPLAPIRETASSFRSGHIVATPTFTTQRFLQTSIDADARQFKILADEWHRETAAHSSMTMRQRHPAYRKMANPGWPVVPLLLLALRDMPDHWFPLLRDITKENPVNPDDRGDYRTQSTGLADAVARKANFRTSTELKGERLWVSP